MMSQQYHSDKILWFLGGEDTDTDIPPVLRLQDRGEHCLFLLYWTNRHYLDENFSSDIYSILERNHSGCKISAFADTGSPWLLILLKNRSEAVLSLIGINSSLSWKTSAHKWQRSMEHDLLCCISTHF